MKKFIVLLVLAVALYFIYVNFLTAPDPLRPMGKSLVSLVIIGLGWAVAVIGTALAAPGAFHELVMSRRRRKWHREIRRERRSLKIGITTAML